MNRIWRGHSAVRVALLFCAALLTAPAEAAKPTIGQTSLVVQRVEGTSEQNTRQLALSDPVYQDEVVVTGAKSASEMRLVDETRVTVGPNSKVVLDKFVYDPDPDKGALVLQASKGVFRFFSGTMASSSYVIEAPSVTVGIRGTVFVAAIRPTDQTFVLVLESRGSEVSVTTGSGETAVLNAPGQAAIATPDGGVGLGPVPDWAAAMIDGMDGVIIKAASDHAGASLDQAARVATAQPPAPARESGDRRIASRDAGTDGGGDDDTDSGDDDGGPGGDDGDRDDDEGRDDGDRDDGDRDDGDRGGHGGGSGHGKADGRGHDDNHGNGEGHGRDNGGKRDRG